jgi:hypothetical protein
MPFALLLVSLGTNAVRVNAQAANFPGGQVKRLWETVIEDDAFEVEYKSAAVSDKNESIWLVLGRRPALMMTGPQTLALRTLDRLGKTLSEISIESLAKAARLQHVPDQVIDLAAMADGSLAVVLGSGRQVSVVTVDGKGSRGTQAKDIGAPRPDLYITRALPTRSGNLLLIGRLGVRAIAIKLDRNLDVTWEKSANPADATVFLDGAVYDNESFVLTGAHSSNPGASLEVSLWLGQFDGEGQVAKSISLPGRVASVATAPDGGCVIVQGVVASRRLEFRFRSYDRNLKESWNADLLTGTLDSPPFRLSPVPGIPAGYLIVGSENRHLWLSRIRAGSSILWAQTIGDKPGPMPELVWNFGLAATPQTVIIPFTDMVVNAKMQQRQVVKVMSVDAR